MQLFRDMTLVRDATAVCTRLYANRQEGYERPLKFYFLYVNIMGHKKNVATSVVTALHLSGEPVLRNL